MIRNGTVVPELWEKVGNFSLVRAVKELRQPILVFGGARDVLVPPTDAQHLAKAAGERATLVWYPRGGHCLYEIVDQWTFEAAAWIEAVADAFRDPGKGRDVAAVSARARAGLDSADYTPRPRAAASRPDDAVDETARLPHHVG